MEGLLALPLSPLALLFEACSFASVKHRDRRRKDTHGSPYINHPLEAAHLLATVGGVTDAAVLTATVLHDVLEDTSTTPSEIERLFGSDIRRLVEEVTDTPGLPTDERRRQQLDRARKASARARLIRLADKAANLSALPHEWGLAQRRPYLEWMGEMAAALGGTNAPLEALLAERLRQAWAQSHAVPSSPIRPARALPSTATKGESTADLARALARLQSQLSNAEELADLIASMLAALGIRLVRRTANEKSSAVPAAAAPPRRPRRFADPRLRDLAKPGVGTLHLRKINTRAVAISIDGAPEFTLTPSLAALLDILASGEGPALDGFPPFLPYPEVAVRLSAVTGRPAGVRAVVVGISRLRVRLQAAGRVSPLLVETAARRGARFRIRRAQAQ
jgi:guanosine-3',5'-bis(diphosphate) 3'-pyrophosphohydrolase